MSTFKVTVEQLRIMEHPNADALELAEVGLYRAVVRKGQFKTGDWALYIPEQAVLPPDLIEELGLTGRLAGANKDRVKAVRLRGELSQGIVCRPAKLDVEFELIASMLDAGMGFMPEEKSDYSEELGITKWEPPIPVGMAGDVEAASGLLPWTDIENIKRFPDIFAPGELVVVTEKIHGTCFLLTYNDMTGQVWVTSKGMGGKSLALKESDTNLYWRAAKKYKLAELAKDLADTFHAERVGLYGEVYGKGVQDLHYGADASRDETLGFALFDAAFQLPGKPAQFFDAELWDLAVAPSARHAGPPQAPFVPVLYTGQYDYDTIAALAEGKETVSGKELHTREGVVVRPHRETRSEATGGRKIAKFVGAGYLTRSGDVTEYE